jgi:hypothetical protein
LLAQLHELRKQEDDLSTKDLDQRLTEIWDAALLEGCHDVERWRPRYAEAIKRREHVCRLEFAIEKQDDQVIAELADDPCLSQYPLPESWKRPIEQARERVRTADSLLNVLQKRDRLRFLSNFNADIVRRYLKLFLPYQELLREWTMQDILPLSGLGLGPAEGKESLVKMSTNGSYLVRWAWPRPRFSDHCLLALCDELPQRGANGQVSPAIMHRWRIDRKNYDGLGYRKINLTPDQRGFLVVWALVDLGFVQLWSDPLVLGHVR